jgi:hypothetical protein
MLNTYIKNQGISKTFVRNNNRNYTNEMNWDTDYDGDVANIRFDENQNGLHRHYEFSLDNEDLANILNVESVNIPIDKRLEMDFNQPQPSCKIQVIPSPMSSSSTSSLNAPKMIEYYRVVPSRKYRHHRHKSRASHKVYRGSKSRSFKRSPAKRSSTKRSSVKRSPAKTSSTKRRYSRR